MQHRSAIVTSTAGASRSAAVLPCVYLPPPRPRHCATRRFSMEKRKPVAGLRRAAVALRVCRLSGTQRRRVLRRVSAEPGGLLATSRGAAAGQRREGRAFRRVAPFLLGARSQPAPAIPSTHELESEGFSRSLGITGVPPVFAAASCKGKKKPLNYIMSAKKIPWINKGRKKKSHKKARGIKRKENITSISLHCRSLSDGPLGVPLLFRQECGRVMAGARLLPAAAPPPTLPD